MIALRLPCAPNVYPHVQPFSQAQISHFLFEALRRSFEGVKYFHPAEGLALRSEDVLVSDLTNTRYRGRRIIVDNDNFDEDKWLLGKFRKYGMNHDTDQVGSMNELLHGADAAIFMTNDVALERLRTNDPSVLAKKTWLERGIKSVRYLPHPIDKAHFGKHYSDISFTRARMLVYHNGPRKNAVQLIELLRFLGYVHGVDYQLSDQIPMSESVRKQICDTCLVLAHTSVSEGFPYLANELMCGGVMLYGNEEWWDGQGDNRLRWTYDPARRGENIQNLRFLFDPENLDTLLDMKKQQHTQHMNRKDNEWDHFCRVVVDEVKKVR